LPSFLSKDALDFEHSGGILKEKQRRFKFYKLQQLLHLLQLL